MRFFLSGINSEHTFVEWSGGSFEVQVLEETPGFASLLVKGDSAREFLQENGGHRFQRIPPTERKGRVHTSTITVACYELKHSSVPLNPSDVEIQTTRGSGPGGQHKNKVESCVTAIHIPTGLSVRIDGRSQFANRKVALELLELKIQEKESDTAHEKLNKQRKESIGSGQRGDKIRTYRFQDNLILDHRTGQKLNLDSWMKGK